MLTARTSLAAGVRLDGLSPNGVLILGTVDRAARTFQVDLVITSAVRSSDPESLHARGEAIDLRTSNLTPTQILGLYYWFKAELPGFTVLYEVPPGTSVPSSLTAIVYRNVNATGPHFHIGAPRNR